jgi:uncharacterized protein (TIGR00725 family)
MIAVVGPELADPRNDTVAFEVGKEIARRGHVLVCGGRGGAMRAACRGARDAGGATIGILPGEDRAEANEFVDFAIVTGLGSARNAIIARTADAMIAVGGRYGTLSEIALALVWGKPVAGLGTWTLTAPDGELAPVVACESALDAVDYCEVAAQGASG